jgi:hypothetical protein
MITRRAEQLRREAEGLLAGTGTLLPPDDDRRLRELAADLLKEAEKIEAYWLSSED